MVPVPFERGLRSFHYHELFPQVFLFGLLGFLPYNDGIGSTLRVKRGVGVVDVQVVSCNVGSTRTKVNCESTQGHETPMDMVQVMNVP